MAAKDRAGFRQKGFTKVEEAVRALSSPQLLLVKITGAKEPVGI